MAWTPESTAAFLNATGVTPQQLGAFIQQGMLQSALTAANTAIEIAQDAKAAVIHQYEGDMAALTSARDDALSAADDEIAARIATRDAVLAQVKAAQGS